ncbi:MAG: hypothetical protein CTY22_05180 [Methylomonas sp.]|nr:MAG: hypothetical protein CTY23_00675 [Methylomonas sp.]PPD26414.1 MAG: hypothetical protein CTY22_05180 [Methylomonas sp.]PPD38163.1 MAG: hypothetical protein CTY21_05175 [Methylomonas sp.]PPD41849.1 MAG: hypothetical protein CTY17_02950 [Methylomonas sp.]PPD51609.1 MAG: hypothetical protein CTY11_11885 [Methylomonas sp.]
MLNRIILTSLIAICLSGCVSLRTDMVNADGQQDNCQVTGGGLGLGAVIGIGSAYIARSSCVSDMESLGYLAIDEAGFPGFSLSEQGTARAEIQSVVDGTDAKLNGLAPGDLVVSVNNVPVKDVNEAKKKLFGPIEEAVNIAILRQNNQRSVLLKREPFKGNN